MINIGAKFGLLTVTAQDISIHGKQWKCRCECGSERSVSTWNLSSGNTKSCGRRHRVRNRSAFWTEIRIAELVAYAAIPKITYEEIADKMGKSSQSIAAKLRALGLSARPSYYNNPRVEMARPTFPQFEDVPNPDHDRYIGRKPQPDRRAYSLTGNSGALCVAVGANGRD